MRANLDLLARALEGDQYDWLTGALPAPAPVPCPTCRTPMLPRSTPALLSCGTCHPQEVNTHA